jgi:uncharacterized protein
MDYMKKYGLIILFLCLAQGIIGQIQEKVLSFPPMIADILQPAGYSRMDGVTGEKLDAAYQNRILSQDVDRLVVPFRNRTETSCWQSEFWGKWMTSAVLAYRYHPESALKTKLDEAVRGLIATQSPDGYIGNYRDDRHLESWDIWGRKYCMLGLLAYFDLTGDQNVLSSVRKMADHLVKELRDRNILIVQKGNHRGMAASSVLEPFCQLYTRTGEKEYLDFAEEIVRQWETSQGPQLISKAGIDVSRRFPKPESWYGPGQGQKSYEMMSCYEGLLELYRITGKKEYRDAVEKTWNNIRDTEINIAGSGSAKECWFGGKKLQAMPIFHYQETCVTVTWIKLCQQLLRLTGEAIYADAIEQSFYNALLGAMKPDGSDWAKYSPLSGQRLEGSEQCGMGLNCCVASGPRGLFTLPMTIIMQTDSGLQVNFFTAGASELQTPGHQNIEISQETDYPRTGKTELKIGILKPETFTLKIRIPEWSRQTLLSVNGKPVEYLVPGENKAIRQEWKQGDRVNLELDMRGRIVRMGNLPENVAIVRGPVVLARDARLPGLSLDTFVSPVPGSDGYLALEPVEGNQPDIRMQFKALFKPESYKEEGSQPVYLTLCDYASAGNTWDERSVFRVWFPQLIDPAGLPE